jgi:predicted ribosome quality control (RQC) complex YloA/Tae2 family protein
VSTTLRYDSLLVRDLAAELHRVLRGARLDRVCFDRDTMLAALRMRTPRRAAGGPHRDVSGPDRSASGPHRSATGPHRSTSEPHRSTSEPYGSTSGPYRSANAPPSLLWQLHPQSGHLTTAGADDVTAGQVQLATTTLVKRVSSPPDERLIIFELDTGGTAPAGLARRIIIELITNQWNAVAVGADDRITAVLREREVKGRRLRAGAAYELPRPSTRLGAHTRATAEQWLTELAAVPPGERLRAVLRFAYASPLNAAAILGDADVSGDNDALRRAFGRYTALVYDAPRVPQLIGVPHVQPYSVAIESGEPTDTLLDAFDRAAQGSRALPQPQDTADQAIAAIARRMDAAARRIERLRAQHAGAADEAAHMRAHADLLLAQLHAVPRGAESVELDDYAGGTVQVALDPVLSPADNAQRLYETARRRDRAAARIPRLVADAERDIRRLEALAGRVRDGTATADELGALRTAAAAARADAPALPYREYRTSGGSEVRVGRGSKSNDELTFRHSSPSDIWLHARDVGGAHVILRWPHASSNPPARDIEEAATLAALHSRARTSALVAVDWTRRKYVRKPRKAAPGLVLPERVRTVFVQPDAVLEQRMRAGEGV